MTVVLLQLRCAAASHSIRTCLCACVCACHDHTPASASPEAQEAVCSRLAELLSNPANHSLLLAAKACPRLYASMREHSGTGGVQVCALYYAALDPAHAVCKPRARV